MCILMCSMMVQRKLCKIKQENSEKGLDFITLFSLNDPDGNVVEVYYATGVLG